MPEEQKPEARSQKPEPNGAPQTDELATIKAELEHEREAREQAETIATSQLNRIAELEKALSEAKQQSEAVTAEFATLKDTHTKAVAKYLTAVKTANPTLPADVITGSTIDEIDATLAKALTIAESVKKALEAQAKEAKVPAGAPTRGGIALEAMSPREKIAAGLQQSRS
jgi:molecular chaperone GrpE (heat shock protein)